MALLGAIETRNLIKTELNRAIAIAGLGFYLGYIAWTQFDDRHRGNDT